MKSVVSSALIAACLWVSPVAMAQTVPATAAAATPKHGLQYLLPAEVSPQRLIGQPAVNGSLAQAQELAFVRALVAGASAERMAQARADDGNETPSIYNDVMGVDLKTMPATWELLTTMAHEASAVANYAKFAFMRQRPWGADKTIKTCSEADPTKEFTSYPSGHATNGYAMARALVEVAPHYAPGILSRADDYALSRSICGQHYPSDAAAGRAIALQVVDKLLADPRLSGQVAAARAEIAAAH